MGLMIKILPAIVAAALLAATGVLLSGMTPVDPAASALAYGKADEIVARSYGPECSERSWPYYEPNCLRGAGNSEAKRVRIVPLDRLQDEDLIASR
jgi:hypothetical protein